MSPSVRPLTAEDADSVREVSASVWVDDYVPSRFLDWLDNPHRLPSSGVATGPFWRVDRQFAYNSVGFFSGWAQADACNGHIAFCRS